MPHPPFFHAESGAVRFWVQVDGAWVGATVGKETLHYVYQPGGVNDDALATYTAHAAAIEAAVHRRVAGGSREPVMLREHDLRAPLTPAAR